MYRFRLKFNYLYALSMIFLIVGMALWSFIPPRPSAVLPKNATLTPDTNVQYVGFRGLVTTPFSDYNSQLGQEVVAWVKTLPINSVEEAASWVLSHTVNNGDAWSVDSSNAFQLLKMIKDGKSVVRAVCDQITDMFLIIVNVKGLAGAGTQAVVKVKGGGWDNADHAIAIVVSHDGTKAFFFYTWPFGYYSVSYYDGLGWTSGSYPQANDALTQLENSLKQDSSRFPTADGWYSISDLVAVKQQPKNATTESTSGCPLYGSYNKIQAPENCTTCPKKPGTITTTEGEPSGIFYAWIKDGNILFRSVLSADWPNSDQVGINLLPQRFYITCLETGRTIRVDHWHYHSFWWGGWEWASVADYYAMEPNATWYHFGSKRVYWDYMISFHDMDGHPLCSHGYYGVYDCTLGNGPTWKKYPKQVILRDYVWTGSEYKPRPGEIFKLKDMRNYLLGPNAPRIVHLTFTQVFPAEPQEACLSLGANGVCLYKVVVMPKSIGMTLVWDTATDSGSGEASGNLTLILNQREYAPNETATAWLKAGMAITQVDSSYDSTKVNFTKDSPDGKVWKASFRVPSSEGTYTLVAKTNLGTVNASFRVTPNPVQEPIIVRFDRDPPTYKVGERVGFTIAVSLNGSYDISAYVTAPSGAFQAVQLNRISQNLFEGTYSNTAWEGKYKLSIVVNGTGCFFRDKQMNNVKKEAVFTVSGVPYAVKVWFNKDVYQPNDKVVMWISVNPMPNNVTATLENGVTVQLRMVENLWKGEFYAPSIKGEHRVLVTADGFSVIAKFTVGDQAGNTKLIVFTDRDSYKPGSQVRIIGYIQNGVWGKGVSNPKVTVTKPDGKIVEVKDIKYFQNDPEREDLIYAYFADTQMPGAYTVQMELLYGYVAGTGDKLIGTTRFTVLGNVSTGGITGIAGSNPTVYDWLVSHGVPAEIAKFLSMPIVWIALAILVVLLARRSSYTGYRGRW